MRNKTMLQRRAFGILLLSCVAVSCRSATAPPGNRAAPNGAKPQAADTARHSSALDAHPFGDALGSAKAYLVQAVAEDGRFTYEYDPATDLDSGAYNLLRHAGTIYAMMELYAADRDPRLLEASDRALGYLLEHVKPGEVDDTACLVEAGFVKLGGNALAIVALAEYTRATGDRRHVPVILQLGRWILLNQEATGRFVGHKQHYPGGQRTSFVSGYYPGEAVLALSRLHALDPDGPWMARAHRGADWLIRVRDAGRTSATIAHDHWLLYGLAGLYRDRAERTYVDHTRLIVGAILQANVGAPADEESGDEEAAASSTTASVNQVATRIEGLCAAHALLTRAGEESTAEEVRAAVTRASQAVRAAQFTGEVAARYPRPERVAGGFRSGPASDVIRIDTVQHAVSALLRAGEIVAPTNASTATPASAPTSAR